MKFVFIGSVFSSLLLSNVRSEPLPMWNYITKGLKESVKNTEDSTGIPPSIPLTSTSCSEHLTCGDCAADSNYFASCRWCPLIADNKCHAVGSTSNPCESDQQITDPTKCPAFPSSRKPIVILPGLIGSSLEVKLTDKQYKPSPICQSNADWFKIWIDFIELGPEIYKCSVDSWSLEYDKETESVSNQQGVDLRYIGGEVDEAHYGEKVDNIVGWEQLTALLQANGYVAGEDLFAAAFDWRMGMKQFLNEEGALGPANTGGEFKKLKGLIEKAYEKNDGAKVTVTSISYGGPYGAAFFSEYAPITAEWKEKYIDQWISISGVFNGAPQMIHQLLSGMPAYGIDWIDEVVLRDSMRNFPSMSFLVPSFIEGEEDVIVAYTKDKNYTLSEVADLLEAGGAVEAADMKRKQTIVADKDPGVKTHCWYTDNMVTEVAYAMESPTASNNETLPLPGLGDQTGDKQSLSRCESWEGVEVRHFDDVCHSCYLNNEPVLNAFLELVVE